MKRHVYVYQEAITEELQVVFESINDAIRVESLEDNLLTLIDEDYFNEEPIDLEAFYALVSQDFGGDVTMIIEPYMESDFPLSKSFQSFIQELPHNVYYFEDVITYAVLKNKQSLKQEIIAYLGSLVNQDVIHTVREFIENNMNSSVSAKKLYMHRNTLNYRIDNFIETTSINVKTFKGANAIYMLYKF